MEALLKIIGFFGAFLSIFRSIKDIQLVRYFPVLIGIEMSIYARMFDIGVKIERLSRGQVTESRQISGEATVMHEGTVAFQMTDELDFSKLTDEELQAFELILEKIYQPQR
jgi:hypothetical protein